MEKYSWSFRRDDEIWDNDTHDTIEGCIAAAKNVNHLEGGHYAKVYIGQNEAFVPCVDASSVLESLEEDAYEFCGEIAEGWNACDLKAEKELEELNVALTTVVVAWFEKYGCTPGMYKVHGVEEYFIDKEV